MYYLNYLIKNATNKDKLKNDLNEIIKNQGPILKQEAWSIYEMNEKLEDSRRNSTPCFEFEVHSLPEYVLPIQNTPPKRTQSEPVQPKADDYDYGGPGFKLSWFYPKFTERVSTSEQTQLKFLPCFFPDYKLPLLLRLRYRASRRVRTDLICI